MPPTGRGLRQMAVRVAGGSFVGRPFLVAGTTGSGRLLPEQRRTYIACILHEKRLGGWADSLAIPSSTMRMRVFTIGTPLRVKLLQSLIQILSSHIDFAKGRKIQ